MLRINKGRTMQLGEEVAQRRQKQRQSLLDDLFEITARLPLWVGVVLAAVTYLWLHRYAGLEVSTTAGVKAIGGSVISRVFKTLAMVGQYLLPTIFLLGAVASAVSHAQNDPGPDKDQSLAPDVKRPGTSGLGVKFSPL
jgi:hypothetical protein